MLYNHNPGQAARSPMPPAFGHRRSYYGQQATGGPPPMPAFQRTQSYNGGGGAFGGALGGQPRFGAPATMQAPPPPMPMPMPMAPRGPAPFVAANVGGPAFGSTGDGGFRRPVPAHFGQPQQQPQQQPLFGSVLRPNGFAQPAFGAPARHAFGGPGVFGRPQQQWGQGQQQQQGSGTGFGTFGQLPARPLFGTMQQTQAPAFGQPQQQQQQQQPTGIGFRQQAQQQQAPRPSLFGGASAGAAPFGNPSQQPQPFGATPSPAPFGSSSSSTNSSGGGFGLNNGGTPLFGATGTSIWSTTQASTTGPFQQQQVAPLVAPLTTNPAVLAQLQQAPKPFTGFIFQPPPPPLPKEQPLDRRMRELNERLARMGVAAPASSSVPSSPASPHQQQPQPQPQPQPTPVTATAAPAAMEEEEEEADDPWLRPVIYRDDSSGSSNSISSPAKAASGTDDGTVVSPFRPLSARLAALAEEAGAQGHGLRHQQEEDESGDGFDVTRMPYPRGGLTLVTTTTTTTTAPTEPAVATTTTPRSPLLLPLRVASPTGSLRRAAATTPTITVGSPRSGAAAPASPAVGTRRAIRELDWLAETAAPGKTPQAVVQEYLGAAAVEGAKSGGGGVVGGGGERLVRSRMASPKAGAGAGEEASGKGRGKGMHVADAF